MKVAPPSTYVSIKSWAVDDRPREKLEDKGRTSLSDAELLAILLGTGTKEISAVDLSKQILRSVKGNLNELGKLSITELIEFKGIGKAKAISIAAALELGRRRRKQLAIERTKITGSKDVFEYIHPELEDKPYEEFWVIFLNRANSIIDSEIISRGGVSGTVVDPKIVFRAALQRLASSIILCHNHPSGNLKPSDSDRKLTRKVVEAGKLVEINVLDHLIIGDNAFFSFADHRMI